MDNEKTNDNVTKDETRNNEEKKMNETQIIR